MSYTEKMATEHAARRVKGVHGIAQEIEIRYSTDKKSMMTKSPAAT